MSCRFALLAFALSCGSCGLSLAQDKLARSILTIGEESTSQPTSASASEPASTSSSQLNESATFNNATLRSTARSPVISLTSSGTKRSQSQPIPLANAEVVRERYANGKVRIERTVTLDAENNYVNHGEYREFSEKGELLVSGHYELGKRHGTWVRFVSPSDAKLLSSYPFSKFRAPFASTVDFEQDQMHGVWVLADRDKRVACQIQLANGQRDGGTILFHPNGQIFQQSEFKLGVLDGVTLEKSAEGKLIREEQYSAGQKLISETEHYPNKSVKSVMHYMSGAQRVSTPDDWTTTTLATFTTGSNKQLHGEFITYHENGQVATKGSYKHGQLDGMYESWYRTGDQSASGHYVEGVQDGPWIWRHANGMKRASATFKAGRPDGQALAWDENGKAIK